MVMMVNGCGVVGSRLARLLATLKEEFTIGKRSLTSSKTEYLKEVFEEFKHHPVFLSKGEDLEKRINEGKKLGFEVNGDTEQGIAEADYIIDCTCKESTPENIALYEKNNKLFLIQGGAPDVTKTIVSSPNTLFSKEFASYEDTSARVLSCNTHYIATALGLVKNVKTFDEIEECNIVLERRYQDPEDKEKKAPKPPYELKEHHSKEDVESVLPGISGKLTVNAYKMPWKHFHRGTIEVHFKEEISQEEIDELVKEFKNYERCIYLEKDLGSNDTAKVTDGMEKLISAAEEIGIPDGDLLLPTYTIRTLDNKTVRITGYNPQRSIVLLSNIDAYFAMSGRFDNWQECFDYTNTVVQWWDKHPYEIKAHMENYFKKQEMPVIA